ncbi:hypothetical protein [Sandaracinus amylolyticus]|nr:hypothetical protein [Sandaracinus amylolyticus]
MMRRVLLLALVCASFAVGCGDHRLTASGFARFESDDLRTGFELPMNVRIDGDAAAGGVTGSCEIEPVGDEDYAVIIDLFGGGGDEGLRSLTLRAQSDGSSSSVEARVASGTYSGDASCVVELTDVDGDEVVVDVEACTLTSGTSVATLDAHLELDGCAVVQ